MLNYLKLAVQYVKLKKVRTLAGVQVRRGMLQALHEHVSELSTTRDEESDHEDTEEEGSPSLNSIAATLALLGACDLDACDDDCSDDEIVQFENPLARHATAKARVVEETDETVVFDAVI